MRTRVVPPRGWVFGQFEGTFYGLTLDRVEFANRSMVIHLISVRRGHVLMMVAIAVPVAAFVSWRVLPRDEVSRVSPSQALRLFERHMNGAADARPAGGPWPTLGVYRYETQGSETVDVGLLDQTHDYDGDSTVILWAGRCGVVERWQVLATRWSESEACRDRPGARMTTLHEFREFYGVSQEDGFTCVGRSPLSIPDAEPGEDFRAVCTSPTASVVSDMEVVGRTRISVGGEAVDAVHVAGRSTARGESSGSATVEEWRRRADGLLLRREVRGSFSSDAGGGTDYAESYLISLSSLRPER